MKQPSKSDLIRGTYGPILFAGATDSLNSVLAEAKPSKVLVLVDEHTEASCLPLLKDCVGFNTWQILRVLSGESQKNLGSCQMIWEQMRLAGADRNTIMLNLGGGVITDMGGFAASIYQRGIDFIQIPTTLLSQVDASVGGKLGVDHFGAKNQLGCFASAKAVVIDADFLQSLDERQRSNGFAELIKHGLLKDPHLLEAALVLAKRGDLPKLEMIRRGIEIKQEYVSKDPLDKGERAALNLGHSLGHALEARSLESDRNLLLHGEAVAQGIILENFIAQELQSLDVDYADRIRKDLLQIYGRDPDLAKGVSVEELLPYLSLDKKNSKAELRMSLLSAPQEVVVNQVVELHMVQYALDEYARLC